MCIIKVVAKILSRSEICFRSQICAFIIESDENNCSGTLFNTTMTRISILLHILWLYRSFIHTPHITTKPKQMECGNCVRHRIGKTEYPYRFLLPSSERAQKRILRKASDTKDGINLNLIGCKLLLLIFCFASKGKLFKYRSRVGILLNQAYSSRIFS